MDRAELIATLVADRYSGFKSGDESVLEACSDARLEEFRAASDVRRVDEQKARVTETELTKANARLKVSDEKLRAAEQTPSEAEWLEKAPPKYKALIDADKAEEDAARAAIVSSLKDLGANTEAELKEMPLDQLRQLAAYARVTVPDFSGRGVPKDRYASSKPTNSYAPPDPYKEGLAKMSKAIN
jgi:hypothetical protein